MTNILRGYAGILCVHRSCSPRRAGSGGLDVRHELSLDERSRREGVGGAVFGQVHGGAEYHGSTQAGERRGRDASSDVQRICCLQAKLLARTEHSRAHQKQSMIVGLLSGYSSRGMDYGLWRLRSQRKH